MKKDLHPEVHQNATVTCSCGASYTIASTKKVLVVEICGSCHPHYTGTQKLVDTAGNVDKFRRRQEMAEQMAQKKRQATEKSAK